MCVREVNDMKVVIQVCKNASVKVNGEIHNQINNGYVLLVGIDKNDNEEIIKKMAEKIYYLRINKDENDKTNLSISQVNGEILSISQFTLCAVLDSRRPSFSFAAPASEAKDLYEKFNKHLSKYGLVVKDGVFGADMEVSLVNDGPFTIVVTEKDF